VKIFVCPSTLNTINPANVQTLFPSGQIVLVDLENVAANRNATSGGMSYKMYGGVDEGPPPNRQVNTPSQYQYWHKKTENFVSNYTDTDAGQNYPSLNGTKPGPSGMWIFLDSDGNSGTANQVGPLDNHQVGGNVAYCDGHAGWVKAGTDWSTVFAISNDE
jgi:prepilin-type processing-associated H-X9-DG protein